MEQSDPDPSNKAAAPLDVRAQELLPALPREALDRIAQAEKDARKRYERDKMPYFPTHPDFSFLEDHLFRATEQILEYIRIFAEEVLAAHLKEYLEYAPSDLLTNTVLLQSVVENVRSLTNELWVGYGIAVQQEPTSRQARFRMAMVLGTMDQHPELEPWRYPEGEQWADFLLRMARPDSEMARLNARYTATIRRAITDEIGRYQTEAASKLHVGDETACSNRPETTEAGASSVTLPAGAALAMNGSDVPDQPAAVGRPEQSVECGPLPVRDGHVELLEAILDKRPTTLERWAKEHKLGRTTVFDWKALRSAGKSLSGKVSSEKSAEIEEAIDRDAKALGLGTRTNSD